MHDTLLLWGGGEVIKEGWSNQWGKGELPASGVAHYDSSVRKQRGE